MIRLILGQLLALTLKGQTLFINEKNKKRVAPQPSKYYYQFCIILQSAQGLVVSSLFSLNGG
jgi:hypothetical protein